MAVGESASAFDCGAGRHLPDGSRRYYFTDHLGSVRAVVDGGDTVKEIRDYYPYGLELPGRTTQASPPTKEGFTGHERDRATGLVYAGARYYMPAVPRWTAVDPLAGKFPAYSPYNYVMGNPTGAFDPDGMAPVSCPPTCMYGALSARGGLYPRTPEGAQRRLAVAENLSRSAVEILADFYNDAFEVITGRTITGREGHRGYAAAALFIPAVSGQILRLGGEVVGQWKRVNEYMSERASTYQRQIAGDSDHAFVVDGVKFDGVPADKQLLDAKGPGYASFVKDGTFVEYFDGAGKLVDQAQRQLKAANGVGVTWHVAEEEAAVAIRNLFESEGIEGIRVVHTPSE